MRSKWISLIVPVIALAIAAVGLLVDYLNEPDYGKGGPGEPFEPYLPSPADTELAARFQPSFLFDSSERWRPLDIATFLDEGIHHFCAPVRGCGRVSDLDHFTSLSLEYPEHATLRVNGLAPGASARRFETSDQHCTRGPHGDLLECAGGPRAALYYHVLRRPGEQVTYIGYWLYYRFNNSGVGRYNHHSDWEGVVIAVDEANPITFSWAGFDAHGTIYQYAREQLSCDGSPVAGTCDPLLGPAPSRRLNVYVANGTHASYPQACRGRSARVGTCAQNRKIGPFPVPERRYDGGEPWARNDDPTTLQPLTSAWVGWDGQWDPTRHVRSPGRQRRFRHPRTIEGGICLIESCRQAKPQAFGVACNGWFGAAVAVTACNASLLATGEGAPGNLVIERRSRDGSVAGTQGTSPVIGVAQLTGPPLESGERVIVSGAAPAGTELYARARDPGGGLVDARFSDLGLSGGGAASLEVGSEADRLALRLKLGTGETVAPAQQVLVG